MKARDILSEYPSDDTGYGIGCGHAPCPVSPDEQPVIGAALLAARVQPVPSRPYFPAAS